MADEANKEFTIQVQFSGVEQEILGGFKKEVQDVAKAIVLINDTMKEQIKALESIQKGLKDFNAGTSTSAGPSTVGGTASHLAGQSRGDNSEIVREIATLNRNLSSINGGVGSLFGARGLTNGYRQWDEENSFERSQFPNSRFTIQDALRQAGSVAGGYKIYGKDVSQRQLEELHRYHQEHAWEEDPNARQAEEYVADATDSARGRWWTKPFAKQLGHITGTSKYLSTELGAERGPMADTLARWQAVYPYFASGGVFNPGTYGLGISGLREKAAALGQVGRFGMQFGDDQSMNPFSDSGHQYFGARLQGARNSWFGFNPYLSSAQAGEITNQVAGMGYSGGTAESMRGMMSDVTQHTNIGIGDQAAIIDKSFRWGYANLQQLAAFMKNDIPQAAQAARMNVAQFASQLVQVGGGIGTSRAIGAFQGMGQATDLSTGLGIDPGTAGQIMTDPSIMFMAASLQAQQTGKAFNLGAMANSGNAAALSAQVVALRFFQLTQVHPDDLSALQEQAAKDGPNSAAQAKLDHVQSVLMIPGVQAYIPGITSINEAKRFSTRGITDTKVAGVTRRFGENAEAHYQAGLENFVRHHGGDGGKSAWNTSNNITQGWDWLTGGDSPGQEAAKKAEAAWVTKQGGRKKIISEIVKMSGTEGWADSALGDILGHHKVYSGSGRGTQVHEELGDANRSMTKIISEWHKVLAKNTKDKQDKASKNTTITLEAGPSLQGLIRATGGAQSVASGTAPAPSASPTSTLGVYPGP